MHLRERRAGDRDRIEGPEQLVDVLTELLADARANFVERTRRHAVLELLELARETLVEESSSEC